MQVPWRRNTPYQRSRHAEVSRRAALKIGAAATASAVIAACGNNDDVLRDVSIDADASPATTPATTGVDTAATPATTAAATDEATTTTPASTAEATPETPPETTTAPAANAFADGAEMVIDFTYQPTAEGKDESPYTAVWVEDSNGDLLHTIALWRQQNQKGLKYMRTLTRWFSVDQSRIANGGDDLVDVISGPTRFPGSYSVVWSGMSDTIGTLSAGDYFVCIESSREDGPHSLIRAPIALIAQPVELALSDDGELGAASVSVA